MTIGLIAAGFFALGITVILLFRRTIRADDELDRRWAEVVARRSGSEASASEPEGSTEPGGPS